MFSLSHNDPRQIGPFTLIAVLGEGAMGRVYLGLGAEGEMAAVKQVLPNLAQDPGFRRRFAMEVTAAHRVNGTSTVRLLGADTEAPQPWLATDFVLGPTLTEAVEEAGPLPEDHARRLGRDLAVALEDIHSVGLVHRDVKPSNVILAPDGAKLIDFGISRAVDYSASMALTQTGGAVGSPLYMSPEQADAKPLTAQSDVFSVGCVLAMASGGVNPFAGPSIPTVLYNVVHGEPSLSTVPEGMRDIVASCLRKDPAQRPAPARLRELLSGGEVASPLPFTASFTGAQQAEVNRFRAEFGERTTLADQGDTYALPVQPAGLADPPPRKRGKKVPLAIGSAVAALVLAVPLLWFVLREERPEEPAPPPDDGSTEEAGFELAAGEGEIEVAFVPWSDEDVVVSNLWKAVLEDAGYTVTLRAVEDVDVLYRGLDDGTFDLYFTSWLSKGHAFYWDEYGDGLEDFGSWYEGAGLNLTVPAYVEGVDGIEDLRGDPDLFNGEIIGIEQDSIPAKTIDDEVIPAYGLDGFDQVNTSGLAMVAELEAAVAEERPIVVGLWRPHWVYGAFDLKELDDPKGAFGEPEGLHIAGRSGFGEDFPNVAEAFRSFSMTQAELAALEAHVLRDPAYFDDRGAGVEEWLARNEFDEYLD
ncbi:glycine betaine ABC transporter substrate-binding protein [Salininema proteolyticum]|uniref:Glycine betaine ABC transporter substrate-binding protein n=1 Tax=Salininema proteolyticum TaxID=1607685 RepID=A0ABV8U256_9ACTN